MRLSAPQVCPEVTVSTPRLRSGCRTPTHQPVEHLAALPRSHAVFRCPAGRPSTRAHGRPLCPSRLAMALPCSRSTRRNPAPPQASLPYLPNPSAAPTFAYDELRSSWPKAPRGELICHRFPRSRSRWPRRRWLALRWRCGAGLARCVGRAVLPLCAGRPGAAPSRPCQSCLIEPRCASAVTPVDRSRYAFSRSVGIPGSWGASVPPPPPPPPPGPPAAPDPPPPAPPPPPPPPPSMSCIPVISESLRKISPSGF